MFRNWSEQTTRGEGNENGQWPEIGEWKKASSIPSVKMVNGIFEEKPKKQ